MVRRAGAVAKADAVQAMSSFAVGEEAEQQRADCHPRSRQGGGAARSRQSGADTGSTVRVDVVVRTRKIGHFFPGGTVDAFDVWLELQARTRMAERSSGAARWRTRAAARSSRARTSTASYQLDGAGQSDRQAQCLAGAERALRAPDSAGRRRRGPLPRAGFRRTPEGRSRSRRKLNYRKFAHYYTQFAYAGQPKPGQDRRRSSAGATTTAAFSFDPANIPANVSGKIKDRDPGSADHHAGDARRRRCRSAMATPTVWQPVVAKTGPRALERLGHRPAAPGRPEGGRVRVHAGHRGRTRRMPTAGSTWPARSSRKARPRRPSRSSEKALARIDDARPHPLLQGADREGRRRLRRGDRLAAQRVTRQYPRDRVVLNQMARILFLEARVRGGPRGARAGRGRRSRGRADALHGHALLARPGRRGEGGARGEALPPLQGRRVVAGDHRHAAAC